MKQLVQKSIRFPSKAVNIIDEEVRETLGIDFNEFIKVLVINKAEEIQQKKLLSPQLVKEIELAEDAVVTGKKKLLRTQKDIENYMKSLQDE